MQGNPETAISAEDFCCCTETVELPEALGHVIHLQPNNPGMTSSDVFGSRSSLNALAQPDPRGFSVNADSRVPIGSHAYVESPNKEVGSSPWSW